MIAVTFALPSESSDFIRLLVDRRRVYQQVITGTLGSRNIAVLHTGVGETAATASVRTFLRTVQPEFLVNAGFAGALHDTWQPSEIMVAENFSSAKLSAAAKASLPRARLGTLTTAHAIVDSSVARTEMARVTGADAVDMETEFIADACAEQGIPMLSLRAVSDTPSLPFPAPPDVLFDIARQRTNLARIALYVVTHPAALTRFGRFAGQIKQARAALTEALRLLLMSDAV